MLVVIVDDNDIDVMIAEKIVKKSFPNVHTLSFSSGEEFCAHFKGNLESVYMRYSQVFLLLDMYLEDMNGVDVAKCVYNYDKTTKLKINSFLLSAAIEGDKQSNISTIKEIKGFISKPLSPETITEVITGSQSVSL